MGFMLDLSHIRILYLYYRMVPRGERVNALFAGGAQKRTFQMATYLATLCDHVWLASDDEPQCRIVTELKKNDVDHLRIPYRYGLLHTARACIRVLNFVRNNRIDIIHCNDRWTAMFGYLAQFATQVKYVYSARAMFSDKRCSRWFLGDNIIAVSNAVRDNLTGFFGVPSHRITVIYNGTDIKHSSEEERAALRTRYGIATDASVLSIIGRLTKVKGHSILLASLEKVLPMHPKLRVLCVGDGELRDSLQDQVWRSGLSSCVTFCGNQDDVATYIDISEFTVMPSLFEGMPGSAIESSLLGKPVVAADVGGLKEIVKDGVTGLLVPRGDVDRLTEGILYMLQNPDRAKIMGEKAKAFAGQQFKLQSMLSNYENYYTKLLAKPQ